MFSSREFGNSPTPSEIQWILQHIPVSTGFSKCRQKLQTHVYYLVMFSSLPCDVLRIRSRGIPFLFYSAHFPNLFCASMLFEEFGKRGKHENANTNILRWETEKLTVLSEMFTHFGGTLVVWKRCFEAPYLFDRKLRCGFWPTRLDLKPFGFCASVVSRFLFLFPKRRQVGYSMINRASVPMWGIPRGREPVFIYERIGGGDLEENGNFL